MTALQVYAVILNTIIAVATLLIAIYFIRAYNILVMFGTTNTPVPAREYAPSPKIHRDRAEISARFDSINQLRATWIEAGYSVESAHREGDRMKLVMTKELHATR